MVTFMTRECTAITGSCGLATTDATLFQRRLTTFIKTFSHQWCGRRDSNPHDSRHWYLKPARLPIPPRPQTDLACFMPLTVDSRPANDDMISHDL
jgi:hypothetical protein